MHIDTTNTPPKQPGASQANGLKLSRKGPIPNALDQMKQGHAKRASVRRLCQDSGSGALVGSNFELGGVP